MRTTVFDTSLDISTDTVSYQYKVEGNSLLCVVTHGTISGTAGAHYVDIYLQLSADGVIFGRLSTPMHRIGVGAGASQSLVVPNIPEGATVRLASYKTGTPTGNITKVSFAS
jgi:hypothetical protein